MMNQIRFDLLNGYILNFEFNKTIEELIIEGSSMVQLNILGFDNCFSQGDKYIMALPGLNFRFKSKKDIELFISKVVFFNIEQINKIVFFELIDKAELLDLFLNRKNEMMLNMELSKPENVDIYLFDNGKVLSADVYRRSGELYQNIEDYLILLKYAF